MKTTILACLIGLLTPAAYAGTTVWPQGDVTGQQAPSQPQTFKYWSMTPDGSGNFVMYIVPSAISGGAPNFLIINGAGTTTPFSGTSYAGSSQYGPQLLVSGALPIGVVPSTGQWGTISTGLVNLQNTQYIGMPGGLITGGGTDEGQKQITSNNAAYHIPVTFSTGWMRGNGTQTLQNTAWLAFTGTPSGALNALPGNALFVVATLTGTGSFLGNVGSVGSLGNALPSVTLLSGSGIIIQGGATVYTIGSSDAVTSTTLTVSVANGATILIPSGTEQFTLAVDLLESATTYGYAVLNTQTNALPIANVFRQSGQTFNQTKNFTRWNLRVGSQGATLFVAGRGGPFTVDADWGFNTLR